MKIIFRFLSAFFLALSIVLFFMYKNKILTLMSLSIGLTFLSLYRYYEKK